MSMNIHLFIYLFIYIPGEGQPPLTALDLFKVEVAAQLRPSQRWVSLRMFHIYFTIIYPWIRVRLDPAYVICQNLDNFL